MTILPNTEEVFAREHVKFDYDYPGSKTTAQMLQGSIYRLIYVAGLMVVDRVSRVSPYIAIRQPADLAARHQRTTSWVSWMRAETTGWTRDC